MTDRKCAGCGKIRNRKEMIKITRDTHFDIFINPNSKIFGRSVYLCYNKSCIEAALKKNRIQRMFKTSIPENLKGKLLNEC